MDWFDAEEQGAYDEEVMGRVYKKIVGGETRWYASRYGKIKTRVFELGQTEEVTLRCLLQGFEEIMRDEIREDGGLSRNF